MGGALTGRWAGEASIAAEDSQLHGKEAILFLATCPVLRAYLAPI
jgi:hypothetical protein